MKYLCKGLELDREDTCLIGICFSSFPPSSSWIGKGKGKEVNDSGGGGWWSEAVRGVWKLGWGFNRERERLSAISTEHSALSRDYSRNTLGPPHERSIDQ